MYYFVASVTFERIAPSHVRRYGTSCLHVQYVKLLVFFYSGSQEEEIFHGGIEAQVSAQAQVEPLAERRPSVVHERARQAPPTGAGGAILRYRSTLGVLLHFKLNYFSRMVA